MQSVLNWIETRLGKRKLVAINTGYHVDNLGGNAALVEKGIPVYGSDLTVKLLQERGEQARAVTLKLMQGDQDQRYYQAHAKMSFVAPTHLFRLEDGLKLDFGKETVQVYYPGPSQAPDKVVVYFPSKKVLFGSCMILGGESIGNTADADLKEWPNSIRKLLQFDADVVVPGHGDRLDRGLIEHTLGLLGAVP
jgi:glyoxylase-like metal-dependent hydrolase (beta-lactamase superfamily II)